MTLKSLFSLVSCTAVLVVLSTAGCGGSSSSPKDGAAGGGGNNNSDGPSRGEANGTGGGDGDTDAAGEDGGTPDDGGAAGSGGTGGAADANPGDAGRDMAGVPQQCQAGEMCTGAYMCNATRCLRGEREVCHCVNGSLFCGPADCDNTPDAGAPDARRDAAVMTPICAVNTTTGDTCNPATDRMCDTACIAGRQRVCFCNANTDEWLCTNFQRCQ